MLRSCSCHECELTCPVHVIGAFVKGHTAGSRPFGVLRIDSVLKSKRDMLTALKIPDADKYRTHDFRRGHAEDMRRNGATLADVPFPQRKITHQSDGTFENFATEIDRVGRPSSNTAA